MINILRRLLSRLFPSPRVVGMLPAAAPEPVMPVTDPLDPMWRPSGEMVEPLFYDRATPRPPAWEWPSFTQAWPMINRAAE
jgi:hypothetical protein